jgi:hypothetical protein
MLEVSDDHEVVNRLWETTPTKVQVPEPLRGDFFQRRGPMPVFPDNKRTYHRYFLRGKAVLIRRDAAIGTFTKDVSRHGVGFLSPVQLMPTERIELRVPTAKLTLEVARCRRISQGCFDCGGRFVL